MIDWGIRVTTFITNALVLVGYAILYEWLLRAKLYQPRMRQFYLVSMTIAFLLLFHFASVFSMAQVHNAVGVGWTYINFQIATVMYALLANRKKAIFYSLAVLLLVWYWWLPHTATWPLFYLVSLGFALAAQHFGHWLGARPWRYYPFALAFAAPYAWMNYQSLGGIDVGWGWQTATCLLIAWFLSTVHYRVKRQREHNALLREEARIDELTQLRNFRVFNEALLAAYQQSQADESVFALYTLDIDHFKHINDRFGHLMGNRVLETVAKRLRMLAGTMPYAHVHCYRTGGEEFSFILNDVEPDDAVATAIAWQIHDALGELRFTADDGTEFGITVSLGENRSLPEDQNYLDVYNRADQALYSSKRGGRNTITINGTTLAQRTNGDH